MTAPGPDPGSDPRGADPRGAGPQDPGAPLTSETAFEYFGLSLIILRLIRNLSQAEVAERAGIRSNQVSRYETGQVLPQLAQVERLATALGVDPLMFFGLVAQVRALVRTVQGGDRAAGQVAADVQGLLFKANLLQLSLGDRLRGIFARGPGEAEVGELAGLDSVTGLELTPEFLEEMAARLRQQQTAGDPARQ